MGMHVQSDRARSMLQLPRLLPDPIPQVRYVPEYRADGPLKEAYEDTKQVLQVPWMAVVTMAYASFPHFYRVLWSGMRELCGSAELVAAAGVLRESIETAVTVLEPAPIAERLRALGIRSMS